MHSPCFHHHSLHLHLHTHSLLSSFNFTILLKTPPSSMASSDQDMLSFHWYFSELTRYTYQFHSRTTILIVIVFSCILLVIFLHMYLNLVFLHARHSSVTAAAPAYAVAAPPAALSLGLDSATIDSLPIIIHGPDDSGTANLEFKETECSICLGLFEDEEMVKVLPRSSHAYHSACVDKWLSSQSSCPLCRTSVRVHSSGQLLVQ